MHTKRHASRVSTAHDIQALFINKQRPDGSKLFDLLKQDPVDESVAGTKKKKRKREKNMADA